MLNKMKCIMMFVCLAVFSVFGAAGENPIKNSDFARLDSAGKPQSWELMSPLESYEFNQGAVTLKAESAPVRMVQRRLPLKPGNYQLSAKVSGKGEYRVYVEWTVKENEGLKWFSAGTKWRVPAPQADQIVFEYKGGELPAVTLQAKENSQITIAELQITAAPEERQLLQGGGKWTIFGGSRIQDDPHIGMTIETHSLPGYKAGAILTGVPAEPGKTYDFHYKTRGVGQSQSVSGYHLYMLQVDFKDGSDLYRSPWLDTMDGLFMDKKFTFKVPEDWKGKALDIQFRIFNGSCALFSAVGLTEKIVNPSDFYRLVITSPAYRQTIFHSHPVADITGYVEADAAIAKVKCSLEGAGSTEAVRKGNQFQFSFPAAKLTDGVRQLKAELFDAQGKLVKELSTEILKAPPAPVEVVADNGDHRLLINGKPFFPLSMWSLVSNDNTEAQLKALASHGINSLRFQSIGNTADSVLKTLNLAQKCNLKAILAVPFAGATDPASVATYGGVIKGMLSKEVQAHPALLGYFLVDEPAWFGVPLDKLLVSYQILRDTDPYHPVWLNEAPRSTSSDLRPYTTAADIFGIDYYPVPNGAHYSEIDDKTLTAVGKHTQKAADAVEHRKPVWMCLQGFAWGDLARRPNIVYPTYEESRFMAYDALVNGSTGLSWYGLYHAAGLKSAQAEEFFKSLFRVTRELDEMSGLLAGGKILADNSSNGIRYRIYEVAGQCFIVAMNPTATPVDAKLKDLTGRPQLHVLFENRQLNVAGKEISDHFAPYAVHIYAEGDLPQPCRPYRNFLTDLKSDPLIDAIHYQETQLKGYEGKANWIWEREASGRPYSRVWFGREVTIGKAVKSAILLASADDSGEAFIDGQKLGSISGWNHLKKFDLTKHLTTGDHLLSIEAWDGMNLPCGMLAELSIVYQDGSSETIISDENWRVTAVKTADWLKPETVRSWAPAHKLAPYGQGRWSNRVKLPQ